MALATVSGDTADFLAYWREVSGRIDDALARSPLAAPGRELLAAGKHLRGTLTCLVVQACGAPLRDGLPHALAIEAIQAASLIHDDYIDGDLLRRGRPAPWTAMGPRRAVLLGDVLFANAIAQAARRGPVACRIVARAIAATAHGAYREPLTNGELGAAADPRRYRRIVRGKTGALFAAATALGALAARASRIRIRAAYGYGLRLGEAYQIADDAQDLAVAADGPDNIAPPVRLALNSFLGAGLDEDGATRARGCLLDRAREAMRAAVVDRQARARRHLHCLPDNDYSALLRAAPAAVVALVGDDPRSPRTAVMTAEP